MNKGDLVEQLAKAQELSKAQATKIVDGVFDLLAKGIKKDDSVAIAGFGTFKKKKRPARTGRNPKTGEPLQIKASKSVGFKPATALKTAL